MIILNQQMKISSAKKIGTAKKMRKRVHKILTFNKITVCKCLF
ncbi:hypothetical protein SDC9_72353 [bioreactor metagenome]|uniref:Uncharacterized protein n=1 Tax=bioreactor metagenome TaxID=1076179 RepID=A0A644YH94_9ZZZZ